VCRVPTLVHRGLRVMMPMQHFTAEIRPKFGRQVNEAVIGDAGSEMDDHGAAGPARRWVIEIRKPRAHRAAKEIPVEAAAAGGSTDNGGAADSVAEAILKAVPFAAADVTRVFVKRGGNQEVAEKILAGDVRRRSADALAKSGSIRAISRIRICHLREGTVEDCARRAKGTEGLLQKERPMLVEGGNRRRLWGGRPRRTARF
jgi:hypothetical protein